MSDIRVLLHDATELPSELDLERVQRDGRRRQRRPLKIAGAVVTVGLIAAVVTVRVADDDQHTAPVIAPLPTEAPVQTTAVPATTTPATTAPPVTTLPLGEDRLSSESRLGYAGLGPIKLGMSFADAERLGQVSIANNGCGWTVIPDPGSGLSGHLSILSRDFDTVAQIEVSSPEIATISGIRIGNTRDDVLRTYPGAVERQDGNGLRISGSDDRHIDFGISGDRVAGMTLWQGKLIVINPLC